ncbi:hypothetical protein D3C84_1044090 [compost metagenome]
MRRIRGCQYFAAAVEHLNLSFADAEQVAYDIAQPFSRIRLLAVWVNCLARQRWRRHLGQQVRLILQIARKALRQRILNRANKINANKLHSD